MILDEMNLSRIAVFIQIASGSGLIVLACATWLCCAEWQVNPTWPPYSHTTDGHICCLLNKKLPHQRFMKAHNLIKLCPIVDVVCSSREKLSPILSYDVCSCLPKGTLSPITTGLHIHCILVVMVKMVKNG